MIKHIMFYDDICVETVQALMDEMDEVLNTDIQIDGVVLHFSSNGGEICALNNLIDYLNTYSLPLEVNVSWIVASAGFLALLDLEDHILISYDDSCYGMVHLGDIFISTRDTREQNSYLSNSKILKEKYMPRMDKIAMEKYKKCNFPKDWLDNIEQGKDVYMDKDEVEKYVEHYRKERTKDKIKNRIQELQDEIDELTDMLEDVDVL